MAVLFFGFEPGWKGWEDRPRSGYEPGWKGWEDRPRLWPIYRYIGVKLNWGKLISVSDLSNKKILGRGTSGFLTNQLLT